MATPEELEAYRQGYHAGLLQAAQEEKAAQKPGKRQYILALGTFAVGVGGVAAIVSSRKPGGDGDTFAAIAIVTGLGAAALGALRVLLGEPTPTFKLK